MSELYVSLFGKFCVQKNGEPLDCLGAAKTQELFCFLILTRQQNHHREHLANLLWDDQSPAQSRKYLRKALWQVQSSLPLDNHSPDKQPLLVDGEWVQFNARSSLEIDVDLFEQAFAQVRDVPGYALNEMQVALTRQAIALYRGDLLDGVYHDWCLFERERFLQMQLNLLDKMMRYCEAQAHYEDGIAYGLDILRHDRAREHTHRRLMRLYYLSGNRTEALRQYGRCVQTLHDELDVEPSQLTYQLYEQIRQDQLPLDSFPASPLATTLSAQQLNETLNDLQHVQAELTQMQAHIAQIQTALQNALR